MFFGRSVIDKGVGVVEFVRAIGDLDFIDCFGVY